MATKFIESIVEDAALSWLEELSYAVKHGPEIAPGELHKAAWRFISGRQSVSSPELIAQMSFDERKAQRILKKLQDAGLLRRVGRGPATHYKVLQP